MKVVAVNQDSHGFIGLAKDYKSALDLLINTHWLEDNTEVWDERTNGWVKLKDAQGEDWFDDMCRWSINEFNEYWDSSFYLEEVEVFGT